MVETVGRLPDGWDSELLTLDAQIRQAKELRDALVAEMEVEIERVRQSYISRMPYGELERLQDGKEKAWERVRDQYSIQPPEIVSSFQNSRQAAEVLAHYWQGGEVDVEELLAGICGANHTWSAQAYEFALNLTHPNSPERFLVEAARHFLWKDTSK